MPRVDLAPVDTDPFTRIIANRPEIMEAWAALDKALLGSSSTLPIEIKEESRRVLSQKVGCAFCATVGGKPSEGHDDPKMALAVALATQMTDDHTQIDEGTFEALRAEFTNEQIVELLSWLCFKYGSNMLGALSGLQPASEDQMEVYNNYIYVEAPAS